MNRESRRREPKERSGVCTPADADKNVRKMIFSSRLLYAKQMIFLLGCHDPRTSAFICG